MRLQLAVNTYEEVLRSKVFSEDAIKIALAAFEVGYIVAKSNAVSKEDLIDLFVGEVFIQ